MKKHRVRLKVSERRSLLALIRSGQHSARQNTRARLLLMSDRGATDQQIVQALQTSLATVERTRRKYAQGGLPQAIPDRPHPGRAPKLQGDQQARLVAIACSDPPAGHRRWTLQLLAQELVQQRVVCSIACETVRQVLKKSRSSPGWRSNGVSRR